MNCHQGHQTIPVSSNQVLSRTHDTNLWIEKASSQVPVMSGQSAENPNTSFISLKKIHEYYFTPFGNQKKLWEKKEVPDD